MAQSTKTTWLTRITEKITRRIPELNNAETNEHINDLIDTAVRTIVTFANANSYNTEWDYLVIECVVRLYNYEGLEGSIERKANGITDIYESSDILASFLSKNIVPYIRPSGYNYAITRFDLPK